MRNLLTLLLVLTALGAIGCTGGTPAPTSVPTAGPTAVSPTAPPTAATAGPSDMPIMPSVTPAQTLSSGGTPASPTFTPVGSGLIDLHTVDWNAFLATTPDLDRPAPPPPTSNSNFGPYVQVRTGSSETAVQGYAMTDGILYLHFSDDGLEEAVISLFSGGTGGNFGLLVYKPGPTAPVLAAYLGGYKISGVADGNQLLVRVPIYAGWEPNCCPGGMSETHYRLQGNTLVATDHKASGFPEMRVPTVQQFYTLLQQKDYKGAYAFLTPRYQAAHPFADWEAGYNNTVSFTFEASDRPDGTVGIDLISVDQTPSGQVSRHFQGYWTMVWSNAAKQWLLDQGQISLVP